MAKKDLTSRLMVLAILLALILSDCLCSLNQLQAKKLKTLKPLSRTAHKQTIDQLQNQVQGISTAPSMDELLRNLNKSISQEPYNPSSTPPAESEANPPGLGGVISGTVSVASATVNQTVMAVNPTVKPPKNKTDVELMQEVANQTLASMEAEVKQKLNDSTQAPLAPIPMLEAPVIPLTVINGQVITCDKHTNPGLEWLVTQKAMAWEDIPAQAMQPDGDVCRQEWSTYLTCCSAAKVKDFISKVYSPPRAFGWIHYAKYLVQFKKSLLDQLTKVVGVIQAKKIQFEQMGAKTRPNNKSCPLNIYTDSVIDSLYDNLVKFSQIHEEAMSTGGDCFERLKTFQANSICMACSGRGHKLFRDSPDTGRFREKVLTVDVSVGRQILLNCLPTFRQNFFVANAIQIVQALRFEDGNAKKPRPCGNFYSREEMDIIDQGFKRCKDPADTAVCTDKDVSLLCHRTVRLEVIKDIEGDKTLIEVELQENTAAVSAILNDQNIRDVVQGNKWDNIEMETPNYPRPDLFTGGVYFSTEPSEQKVDSELVFTTKSNVIPMYSVDMNVKAASIRTWPLGSALFLLLSAYLTS